MPRRILFQAMNGASFAHKIDFVAKPGDDRAMFHFGSHTFTGIGASVGAGIRLMRESNISHGATVGFDVTLRSHSIVGLGARVGDAVELAPFTVVLDGSSIGSTPEPAADLATAIRMVREGRTPLVDVDTYLSDRAAFDRECS
jgi:UDP-3-O-[3-hydroxymyristoyl] glucosamine N-acyltransferase